MNNRRQAIGSDAKRATQDLEELKAQRTMTEEQKKDAARVRAYYDIPQAVKDEIIQVADKEGLTASAVASVFLADALRRYQRQQLSFTGVKSHSTSPRWDYTIEDRNILEVLRGTEGVSERVSK